MSKSETPATRAAQAKWIKENYARIVQARVKVARLGLTDLAHGAAYEVPESLVTAYQRGQVAGAFVAAERIKELEARVAELEAALAKADEPEWFRTDEEGRAWHSLEDAIEVLGENLDPGRYFVEIETARPCTTIWGVVHVFTETEIEDQYRDGGPFEGPWYKLTVCATEAEARALEQTNP